MFQSIRNQLKLLLRDSKRTANPNIHIIGEDAGLLKMHQNVYLGGRVTFFCNAEISIDEHTMIAHDVLIHTATHDYSDHPMWSKRIDKPVKIGKHVWIGSRATILPGVVIEDYAVIGAGAVVSKNVPRSAVVVGNPARIIKFRNDQYDEMSILNPSESEIIKADYLTTCYSYPHK